MIEVTKEVYRAWVVFTIPSNIGDSVELMGSWSGWKREPMRYKESGEFRLVKLLKLNRNYEFGYLVDGKKWIHDESLEYKETPFKSKNSILEV